MDEPLPRTGGGASSQVVLRVPAEVSFLYLIRLTTTGAAGEVGLTVEELEDLKIAIDELCTVVIEAGDGEALELVLELAPGSLTVRGTRGGVPGAELDELVTMILEATVDAYGFEVDGDGISFVLRKGRGDH